MRVHGNPLSPSGISHGPPRDNKAINPRKGGEAFQNENRIASNINPKTITYQFGVLFGPIKEWSDSSPQGAIKNREYILCNCAP